MQGRAFSISKRWIGLANEERPSYQETRWFRIIVSADFPALCPALACVLTFAPLRLCVSLFFVSSLVCRLDRQK